ncbi:MAG: hypothetical protein DRP33_04700 [Thermotogae bacterium]|nr:MAG: hypothetical protein DRP33_04700 [Thermotogota bacterium]
MRITRHVYLVGSGHFGLSHAFDSSVYVVSCDDQLVMIDTGAGCEPEKIVENIEKENLEIEKLKTVLLTHSHADHSGGAHFFSENFGCDVFVSYLESDLVGTADERLLGLDVAKKSGFYSFDYVFHPCKRVKQLSDGDVVRCGKHVFKAIHVPGHSPGSLCFLIDLPEGRALFSGDTVFYDGVVGLLNIDTCDLSSYRKSIRKLDGLDVDMLFPGHGIFPVSRGQSHIDKAIDAMKRLQIPKNFI